MATFGQDHGAGFCLVAPMATNKAMGHVPISHVFPVLHSDEISQPARIDDLFHPGKKWRVAQDMADLDQSPLLFGRLHQVDCLMEGIGHGLFQKHLIPCFQCSDARWIMHLVLSAVEDGVS